MADNTTLNSGSGGDAVRTIDKLGTKTQVVTLDLGGSGAESLVSGAVPVTGAFYQATQPVSIAGTVNTNTGLTQPLTDTQLRATPVPVSGTFYQATQPVSIASMPTTPVTGTFWQATQPVSGPLTDTQLRASAVPVSGTIAATQSGTWNIGSITTMPTTPVTGTFWQATQPISAVSLPLPSGASTETTLSSLNGKVTACNTGAVTISAVPSITKGTQGTTGFAVQDLKDSGRTLCSFTASAVTANTAEALISLTPYRDLVAGAAATTFAVTSGKRLRLQALILTVRCTSTVNVGGIVRLRMLAGTVLVTSPVHFSVGGQGSNLATAVAGNAMSYFVDLPEGFELSGTMQFGLTQLFSAATATLDVHVIGYEY